MKVLTVIFSALVMTLFGCGGNSSSNVGIKLVVGNMIDTYPAGVMLYGRRKDKPYVFFGQRIDEQEQTISLENGDWEFLVVAWDGSSGAFSLQNSTSMKCGFADAVLAGGDIDLEFQLNFESCGTYNSDTQKMDGGALNPYMFDTSSSLALKPLTLTTMVALSPDGSFAQINDTFAGSAIMTLYNVKSDGVNTSVSEGISSACVKFSSGTINTGLYFPSADMNDLGAKPFAARISLFDTGDCSGTATLYEFKDGIGGLDLHYHITNLAVDTGSEYNLQLVYNSPTVISFYDGTELLSGINGAIGIFPVSTSANTVTKTFTIKNNSTVAISSLSVGLKYALSGEFSVDSNSCGTTLAAGASCSFDIKLGYDEASHIEFFDIVEVSNSIDTAYMAVVGKSYTAFNKPQNLSFGGSVVMDGSTLFTDSGDVIAKWSKPDSDNITGYSVEFFSDSSCSTSLSSQSVAGDVFKAVIGSTVSDGGVVSFKVTATDGDSAHDSTSDCSGAITVVSSGPVADSLDATSTTGGLDASWALPSVPLKSITLKLYDENGNLTTTVDNLAIDTTSYSFTGLDNTLNYKFYVVLVDKFGREEQTESSLYKPN